MFNEYKKAKAVEIKAAAQVGCAVGKKPSGDKILKACSVALAQEPEDVRDHYRSLAKAVPKGVRKEQVTKKRKTDAGPAPVMGGGPIAGAGPMPVSALGAGTNPPAGVSPSAGTATGAGDALVAGTEPVPALDLSTGPPLQAPVNPVYPTIFAFTSQVSATQG